MQRTYLCYNYAKFNTSYAIIAAAHQLQPSPRSTVIQQFYRSTHCGVYMY